MAGTCQRLEGKSRVKEEMVRRRRGEIIPGQQSTKNTHDCWNSRNFPHHFLSSLSRLKAVAHGFTLWEVPAGGCGSRARGEKNPPQQEHDSWGPTRPRLCLHESCRWGVFLSLVGSRAQEWNPLETQLTVSPTRHPGS